jgi:hypothetical protein
MRCQSGEHVETGGEKDLLEMLQSGITLFVLDGAQSSPRGPCPAGKLDLGQPAALSGLSDQR